MPLRPLYNHRLSNVLTQAAATQSRIKSQQHRPLRPMSSSSDHPVLSRLLSSNTQWSRDVTSADPTFFKNLAKGQSPKVLYVGCADSRVPESVIMASKPGDIFVHRNIANQFHLHDDSALSVLAYAVDALGVEHVVIVGHTACGGAAACLQGARQRQQQSDVSSAQSPLQRWLAPLTSLVSSLDIVDGPDEVALPIIVEENVKMQVANVITTDTIQKAWASGKPVHVHGWVYHVEEGRIKDLQISQGPQ